MKILLLADIHSNWPALAAICESFDACLFVGDLVEYGVEPLPCIDWVREFATASVRGNHDHAVAHRVAPPAGTGFRRLSAATRQQHWNVLRPGDLKYLARLPVSQTIELDGLRFYLVHATPRDPLDEYLLDQPEVWRHRLQGIDVDYVCVGHTHVPMQVDLGSCQVINPGSVGQPRDGDPRASYVVIENGVVTFHRVAYDIDAAIDSLRDAGLDIDLVDWAGGMLRSGGTAVAS